MEEGGTPSHSAHPAEPSQWAHGGLPRTTVGRVPWRWGGVAASRGLDKGEIRGSWEDDSPRKATSEQRSTRTGCGGKACRGPKSQSLRYAGARGLDGCLAYRVRGRDRSQEGRGTLRVQPRRRLPLSAGGHLWESMGSRKWVVPLSVSVAKGDGCAEARLRSCMGWQGCVPLPALLQISECSLCSPQHLKHLKSQNFEGVKIRTFFWGHLRQINARQIALEYPQ